MRKKMLTLTLCLATALSLGACGKSGTSSSGSSSLAPSSSAAAPSLSPSASPGAGAEGTKEIKVTAKNFEYDKKEIHVKKGDKVKLTLVSSEGTHGLQVPDYNINLTGNGSQEFTADKIGTFEFHCSVPCGSGHANMKGKLIVE